MPFRLLGLVADPSQASNLCGRVFAHYAASGTDVTLVCAAASDWSAADQKSALRRLGVGHLVLLDFASSDLSAAALEAVFTDVMASVRPHVVVADATLPAIRDGGSSAFLRVRRAGGGSSSLPAKLYYRWSASAPLVSVTTSITVSDGASPELFVRVFPDPWVTGVLERDLFAGVPAEMEGASRVDQQMAS